MRRFRSLPLSALLGLAACGSSSPSSTPQLNAWLGTASISAGNVIAGSNCVNTVVVTFTVSGSDKKTLPLAAGDCVEFLAGDTTHYQPASIGTPACPEFDSPGEIAAGTATTRFTTAPLAAPNGPRTCRWEDSLHPPSTGGGGGGGY